MTFIFVILHEGIIFNSKLYWTLYCGLLPVGLLCLITYEIKQYNPDLKGCHLQAIDIDILRIKAYLSPHFFELDLACTLAMQTSRRNKTAPLTCIHCIFKYNPELNNIFEQQMITMILSPNWHLHKHVPVYELSIMDLEYLTNITNWEMMILDARNFLCKITRFPFKYQY